MEPQAEQQWAMSDRELLSLVQTELDDAIGWTGTRLAEARRRNLNEYFGNPRGDEREGRSQVVSRTTFEQVEWMLPPMMELFASGEEIAHCVPQGEEDAEAAQQATDAVNHVYRMSNGFMTLLTVFKDGAIQKNGVGKAFWYDGKNEGIIEEYENKNYADINALADDPNFEIQRVTAWIADENGYKPDDAQEFGIDEAEQLIASQQVDLAALRFDIQGVRTNRTGRIVLENTAPEEFLINRDARGVSHPTCRFIGERVLVSTSELIRMGYDPDAVSRIPSSSASDMTSQDSIIRASQDDSDPFENSARSDSERKVRMISVYVKADRDNDGISEWWHVVAGGDYGQIFLEAYPSDGHCYFSYTPIPIPHRFYGLALADVTHDINDRETTLWRQLLDCAYFQNDPRTIVLSRGTGEESTPMANLDQLLDSVPGGYIEEYEKGAIRPFESANNSVDLIPVLELHDRLKVNRTGISPEAMGIDPKAISKHVYGAMVQQTGAQARIILYARIAAETCVKDMFRLIYKLLMQHQTEPMMIRLRGNWVQVDPREWQSGWDIEMSVGLGHGSKLEKALNAESVAELIARLVEGGYGQLVSDKNVYNVAAANIEARGYKDISKFLTDPEDPQAMQQPPKPDPAVEAIQAQLQLDLGKLELERQKVELDRWKLHAEIKKIELDHEAKIYELRLKAKEIPLDDPSWTLRVKPDGAAGNALAQT